jgi:hypothetical protein
MPITKPGKYGITERKKAELDAKTLEVLDVQQEVDQFQAIVTALTQKLNNFQGLLATADTNRTKALSNKNIVDQLVQSTADLLDNSNIAFNEIVLADSTTKDLAVRLKDLIDKLIYTVEIINKLSALVISKKALNPLISDELVSMVGQAGGDANNAVALTLIALQSTFASQSANMESEAAAALEYAQVRSLYQTMTGTDATGNRVTATIEKSGESTGPDWTGSLQALIHQAYADAKEIYNQRHDACNSVTVQLNLATVKLNKAQVKLRSLQTGLSAGTAAAMVS